MDIFVYLLLTIVIEGVLLALLMRGWHRYTQVVLLLANASSWSVLQILWRSFNVNIWILECFVVLFEGIALRYVAQISPKKSFLFAFLTNAGSLGIGIIIHGIP